MTKKARRRERRRRESKSAASAELAAPSHVPARLVPVAYLEVYFGARWLERLTCELGENRPTGEGPRRTGRPKPVPLDRSVLTH